MLSLIQQVQQVTRNAEALSAKWSAFYDNNPHNILHPHYQDLMDERTDIEFFDHEEEDYND